jgi:F-type H+-transporting ATPase subunit delta
LLHRDRWAAAFIATADKNTAAALACLKAMIPPVKSIPGQLSGYIMAKKTEKLLRESIGKTMPDPETEHAIRFICLMIEKNCFRHIDSVLRKIEHMADELLGILEVTIESALPLKKDLEENLTQMLKMATGAAKVTIYKKLAMELLGGYRLRIGDFFVDASLKGQLDQMKAELIAGDNNGKL